MKKTLLRLLIGASVLFALLVLAAWWGIRTSLPTIDGEVQVDELSATATIERDDSGVPVITAANRTDLAFATGYAHAQDRFFQMDTIRRQAAGELSELVGAIAINVDKRFRFHRFRARAKVAIARSTDYEKALIQSYADGVNAGLSHLGARPFEYLVLGVEPKPWLAEDSLLILYAMFMQLNDSRASNEVRRGLAHSILPTEVYDWMYPSGTPWDAPLMGSPRTTLAIPAVDVISLRGVADSVQAANEKGSPQMPGSNNWAVSGALTQNGRALVSNDMHLGLSTPNIYYRARLVVHGEGALDVTGVTLPGTPLVVAGSNTQLAWGYTNSNGDYTDAVVLQPGANADTYKTPDGDRAFDVYDEIINVKNSEPVKYRVRETIWGPVLDDVEYSAGEVVVSWIAHKAEAVNLNLLKLETTTSVSEALEVASTLGMPPQNFVSGDADGNIGWTIAGKIPLKTDFDAQLPADWSEQHGWTGWLASANYPRVYNPPSGRIWTANARVADGDALRAIGDGAYDIGARASQIRDALFASDTFVPEDMLRIQYDDRALFLSPWRDLLLDVLVDSAINDDADLAEYRQLVVNWIPRAVPESVGYRLVRAFRLEVQARVFHALTAPVRDVHGDAVRLRRSNQFEAALWSLVTEQPMHMLPGNYDNWNSFLLAAVRQNIEYFNENFEGPLSMRTWGEVNTAAIRHPLSSGIPLLGSFLDMPTEPLNGDSNVPKAQSPAFGASERFSVSPGDEANGLFQMPTGQSGHPLSPYYSKGHSDWVKGIPKPFLPGKAHHTLTLLPD